MLLLRGHGHSVLWAIRLHLSNSIGWHNRPPWPEAISANNSLLSHFHDSMGAALTSAYENRRILV
jgi:hypothetical protein